MKPARLVILGCSFLLAVAGPTLAAKQQRDSIPSLKRFTRIVGDEVAWTTVRLPKPIDVKDGLDVEPLGKGRIKGFVLTQGSERLLDTPTLIKLFPGNCNEPGCGKEEFQGGGGGFLIAAEDWTLPTGVYRLYVIADRAEVDIKLTIAGYRGRTTIAPDQPARSDLQSYETRPVTLPTGTIYSGGGFSEMGGGARGFALLESWSLTDPNGATAWDSCLYYEGQQRPPEELAFAPGCPAQANPTFPRVTLGAGYGQTFLAFHPVPIGFGLYSASALPANAGGVVLWMPLDERTIPGPSPSAPGY